MIPRVDIGVTCSERQGKEWWVPLLGAALSACKNNLASFGQILAEGTALTDHNANQIAKKFLAGKSDWLWMIEDDTVPPKYALPALLAHGKPFVSGIYYLGNPPHNPVAYFRNSQADYEKDNKHVPGLYRPVKGWERGEIFEVDSVGMGCALIHRSVYEKIQTDHALRMRRKTGTVVPVRRGTLDPEYGMTDPPDDDTRAWPFYLFDAGRTQDHFFAELAESSGFKPLLDTSIECEHWKMKPITGANFRAMSDRMIEYELTGA